MDSSQSHRQKQAAGQTLHAIEDKSKGINMTLKIITLQKVSPH